MRTSLPALAFSGFVPTVDGWQPSFAGREQLRAFIDERFPAPPIGRLTGLRPTDAGLTHSTFTLPVTRWLQDATGYLMPASAALVSETVAAQIFAGLVWTHD